MVLRQVRHSRERIGTGASAGQHALACGILGLLMLLGIGACATQEPPAARVDLLLPDRSATPVASVPASSTSPDAGEPAACAAGMVLVTGSYCPAVRHECLRWADPPGRFGKTRCAEFRQPARCEGERRNVRYCIDRDEYTEPGDERPKVRVSWTVASQLCQARNARLCTEDEWQFACEGEELNPYPYGYTRDSGRCNIDQTKLGRPGDGLTDLRRSIHEDPGCVSTFGVHHLTGNVDEWTARTTASAPHRSALHGGWWLPGRNSCRAATLFHEETYAAPQVGFRCCSDAGG